MASPTPMMSTTPRRSISQKVVKGAKSTAKAVTKPAAKGYRSLYAWTKRLTTGSSTKGKFATPVSERGLASPSTDRADFTPDEMSSPSEAPSSPAEESPTLAPLSYIKQIGGVGEEPMMAEEPATTVAAATAAEAEAAAEAVAGSGLAGGRRGCCGGATRRDEYSGSAASCGAAGKGGGEACDEVDCSVLISVPTGLKIGSG